jgi:hypothetical protein
MKTMLLALECRSTYLFGGQAARMISFHVPQKGSDNLSPQLRVRRADAKRKRHGGKLPTHDGGETGAST